MGSGDAAKPFTGLGLDLPTPLPMEVSCRWVISGPTQDGLLTAQSRRLRERAPWAPLCIPL